MHIANKTDSTIDFNKTILASNIMHPVLSLNLHVGSPGASFWPCNGSIAL
jgi:hypothetical protein